jgi:hypothetical protein
MMVVSPGDWNHSKVISGSPDRGPECGSAVRKPEGSIPSARSLVVVEEAKIGDGEGRDQSYPECSPFRENSQSNREHRGMADGKRGMIKDREQNGRLSPGHRQIMHSTAGITQLSRLCPL